MEQPFKLPATEPKDSRRRSGSEKRKKQYRTSIRWDESDYLELRARADAAGMTVGSYIRQGALTAPSTAARRRPSAEYVALAKLQHELNGYREAIAAVLSAMRKSYGGHPPDPDDHKEEVA
jgi:hypothetical protein